MSATANVVSSVRHSTLREGILAGVLGATGVAIWFFVVDAVGGRMFYTPAAMGEELARVLGFGPLGTVPAVIIYTIFHYAVFIVVSTLVAAIVHRSRQDPTILAAMLLVFVAAEAGFYAFMTILIASALFGRFGWFQLVATNILGAGLVGLYLWRAHPGLKAALDEGLGSTPEKVR
jgi:hypothetical protein